ncbi:methyl-accepting chemotaxis protein [Corallincola platygyrae]|uniref:Methyl-accepting chemotaxis protein n=1 Tax=Corallincola platygyrae TaxID=1193278 RepID=A0ABW4XSQ0_9GAMM
MANWSLRRKLLWIIAIILLLMQGLLSTLVGVSLSSTGQDSSESAADAFKSEVVSTMQFATQSAAEEVSGYLNRAFDLPKTMAAFLSNTSVHSGGQPFTRDEVKKMAQHALASHPDISSIYAQFEPNGYDGRDAQHKNNPQHSSNIGTLEVYWLRDGNKLVYEETGDPNDKYLSEKDENGIREAEWYLCSRDSLKPCTIEPYLYEIEEGVQELMTTLSWPVLGGGKFRGLVGIDINLPVVQKRILEVSNELFGGQGEMLLISEIGLLVASVRHPDSLGQSLKKVDPELAVQIAQLDKGQLETETDLIIARDIVVNASNTKWQLIFKLPKSVALKDSIAFQSELKSAFDSTLWQMVLFGIIGTVITVFIVSIIITGFIRPLAEMSRRFTYLAGAEGDLTIKLNRQKHKELNEMSDGFNLFTTKLRTMIATMKTQTSNLHQQSAELGEAARESSSAAQVQFTETESVATAVHEMSTTAQEVSALAQNTLDEAINADGVLKESSQTFSDTVSEVRAVAEDMDQASERIGQVAERSNEISGILDTIRAIAEQTNLLALNAAIEAARAGEQGRGFAVVADEVRNLAKRTQDSTEEIDTLIRGLQKEVDSTVEQIEQGKQRVENTVTETERSYQGMEQITGMIAGINDNAAQVATAAEEQSHVTEDINRNVTLIGDSSRSIADMAGKVEAIGQTVNDIVGELDQQLSQLKSD